MNEAVWISSFKFFSELFSPDVHYLITCCSLNGNPIWNEEEKSLPLLQGCCPIPLGAVVGRVLSPHYQFEWILGWKPTSSVPWVSLCSPFPGTSDFETFPLHVLPALQLDTNIFVHHRAGASPCIYFIDSLNHHWKRWLSPTITSPCSPQNLVPKCHVPQTHPGLWLSHFPEQPVPTIQWRILS